MVGNKYEPGQNLELHLDGNNLRASRQLSALAFMLERGARGGGGIREPGKVVETRAERVSVRSNCNNLY